MSPVCSEDGGRGRCDTIRRYRRCLWVLSVHQYTSCIVGVKHVLLGSQALWSSMATRQPAKPAQTPPLPGWTTGVMATPPDGSPAPPPAYRASPAPWCQRLLNQHFLLSQRTRADEMVRNYHGRVLQRVDVHQENSPRRAGATTCLSLHRWQSGHWCWCWRPPETRSRSSSPHSLW